MSFQEMNTSSNEAHVDYSALIQEDRIHGSLYTSEAVFKDEMQRIFREGWG